MKSKSIVVYPYTSEENEIDIITSLVHYMKDVQSYDFKHYMIENGIVLNDERSLASIMNYEMKYNGGVCETCSFIISMNLPCNDGVSTTSIWDNNDVIPTKTFIFYMNMGLKNSFNIDETYKDSKILQLHVFRDCIHPSFLNRIFDKFNRTYFMNIDIVRNIFKKYP